MRLKTFLAIQMAAAISALAADRGKVRIEVVDAFGAELNRGVQASLYKESSLVAKETGGSPILLKDIGYGHYTLEIICPGFRRYSRRIVLSQPDQNVKVGLALDKVGDPEAQGLTIVGKVTRCSPKSSMWVRLVGLFTNEVSQASVGSGCAFRLTDLDGGRYLAILFDGRTLRDTKEVKVTVDSPPLVFEK